ncbi:MAG TPA: maltose alpha-D-glucosyltransferase [Verrucomicrobiae bacterium]|jgi:maltose alpha-D-glucosyltransferase/alpha-amylase|nr:maltose alpha-D-glucosyltransferase [Verrucomicrobiae bacterium]
MPANHRSTLEKNPLWYKNGVIYELHVRAFHDSSGDGIGDFRGLTEKLDYLRDLGVTALWLLPFYPSPLKDDGYDIADYYGVHPSYGTLADFRNFLREAHRRGLRVITELVMNHTSDRHPWFQRARHAPPGSKWRDYYVWSEASDKYKAARIIFKDTEISNWTWDPLAKAYYWHRFYSHQPDLNFDSEAVQREMIKVLDFWFDMGVDGMRLDAVPYLYEREGTSCENLPETHAFLKMLRRHVDEKYGDRMLLAEANQWPEDAVAYFGEGKGDECHMAFHFPLMPRLFMSLRMEDRTPIVDILQQTPAIPETAQWVLFLRNHDELTLEMVTDEERDYMYRTYAQTQQARLNLGIRRRLAPLLGNDRRRIELLCALLFSLPGTPVIYYGDEIGMGENIFLGDRNGVRTPMQWSADRNAGFSRANPQSLYLPINLDPENHYEAVNVDVQERNAHSLLWFMKRLIALYKRWKPLGMGAIEFLRPDNRKILACVRQYENERILLVANLSRFVQPVELDLAAFKSWTPVELFGRAEFPAITDQPYFLTLGPHAFYWFLLENKAPEQLETTGPAVKEKPAPVLHIRQSWEEVADEAHRFAFERALFAWLPSRRWFRDLTLTGVHVHQVVPMRHGLLIFVEAQFRETDPQVYLVPLACATQTDAGRVEREGAPFIIARLQWPASGEKGVLYDAVFSRDFARELLDTIARRGAFKGGRGRLFGAHTAILRRLRLQHALDVEPALVPIQQNNTSIVFGDVLILKFFRRLDSGVNPDLEITEFLSAQKFPYMPPLAGSLEFSSRADEPATIGVMTAYIPKAKNGWDYTLDNLDRFFDRVQTLPPEKRAAPATPTASITRLAEREIPDEVCDLLGTFGDSAAEIGRRTAALHLALASDPERPAFAPEVFTPHAQRGMFQSMRNLTRQNFSLLAQRLGKLPEEEQKLAQQVLKLEADVLQCLRAIYARPLDAVRFRIHGDYHLSQLLHTGKEFLIIDFEGEPEITISERRLKRSPLIDVAGMIRSFHYAAQAGVWRTGEHKTMSAPQRETLLGWAHFWARYISAVFFKAYRKAGSAGALLPAHQEDLQLLMDVFLLRKVVYELGYELKNRSTWVRIPLQGILDLLHDAEFIALKQGKTPKS